jgi:16S rRNA (cytidine1402-2'-O)-methyltransferase
VGTLYLVATPIGNLEDITGRALDTLKKARLIAAEDTRQTRKLLEHYQIHTQVISYHEHNKLGRIGPILEALAQGDVALVSDAGTPALNDPGYELVRAVLQAGYPVSPIPGPSAPIAALVVSGLPTDAFLYLGYLPRKSSERQQLLQQVASLPYTLIFLESPHRVCDALRDLHNRLGDRQIAVARELTKLHEEIFRGLVSQALEHFTLQGGRGEFTLVISGSPPAARWGEDRLQAAILQLIAAGASPSRAAGQLATQSGWPRREIYQRMTDLQASPGSSKG